VVAQCKSEQQVADVGRAFTPGLSFETTHAGEKLAIGLFAFAAFIIARALEFARAFEIANGPRGATDPGAPVIHAPPPRRKGAPIWCNFWSIPGQVAPTDVTDVVVRSVATLSSTGLRLVTAGERLGHDLRAVNCEAGLKPGSLVAVTVRSVEPQVVEPHFIALRGTAG
jgi:hypothetical protein